MSEEPQGLELGELADQRRLAGPGPPHRGPRPVRAPAQLPQAAQVNSVGELVQKTEDDLLAITNFGQKSLDEVIAKLDERGLSLRTKD